MYSVVVGDIKGIIISKYRRGTMTVILKDVVHTVATQFNLLLLTKLMSEG